ncbi:allantoinase domain protein [Cardiobacterium valvarum F0432]|uniref:Allantoinase domain protein n=1 Tax=Cardiobacterium valvarum F0432 TaxID=797473 RepID=G9ZIG4_9GAMM|nr:allantoinase domain protein [Cardiobacterium valvarum F0432]
MYDTLITNGLLVLPDTCLSGDIAIQDGKIARIAPQIDAAAAETIDAAGNYVLPGMVDVHMHISEPGRTEWEGYLTGTKAMVAGGTTAFVEMPLNTIPATMDIGSLNLKLEAAKNQCYADYAPMGGLLPWNHDDLKPLSEAGVAAFKAFVATCGSGKPGDFKNVTDYELYAGMQILAETGDLLMSTAKTPASPTNSAKKPNKKEKNCSPTTSPPAPSSPKSKPCAASCCSPKRPAAASTSPIAAARKPSPPSSKPRRKAWMPAANPAHTTSCSRPKTSTPSATKPNAHRPSATAKTRRACGNCWQTASSTSSDPTTRPAPPTSKRATTPSKPGAASAVPRTAWT